MGLFFFLRRYTVHLETGGNALQFFSFCVWRGRLLEFNFSLTWASRGGGEPAALINGNFIQTEELISVISYPPCQRGSRMWESRRILGEQSSVDGFAVLTELISFFFLALFPENEYLDYNEVDTDTEVWKDAVILLSKCCKEHENKVIFLLPENAMYIYVKPSFTACRLQCT